MHIRISGSERVEYVYDPLFDYLLLNIRIVQQ